MDKTYYLISYRNCGDYDNRHIQNLFVVGDEQAAKDIVAMWYHWSDAAKAELALLGTVDTMLQDNEVYATIHGKRSSYAATLVAPFGVHLDEYEVGAYENLGRVQYEAVPALPKEFLSSHENENL